MDRSEKIAYFVVTTSLLGLVMGGLAVGDPTELPSSMARIMFHHGRLISDYTVVGGTGAALINGALVGLAGLILIKINSVRLSGPTIAAVLTMTGFGFFGKTCLNIAPIILGVYLLCRIVRKPFRTYIIIALYGTALGPLFSFIAFDSGLNGVTGTVAAFFIGTVAGLLLPPIAIAMLKLHQGYNLYNLGLTCGFLGLFIAAMARGWGGVLPIKLIWNSNDNNTMSIILLVFSLFYLITGIWFGRKTGFIREMKDLNSESGRLPTDFMESVSVSTVLINMGVMGLLSWLYIFLLDGDFNGPTLGGAFTVMGFASFGKHPRNCLPLMLGVLISCYLYGLDPAAPAPILAALFVTTLAPLAGDFGVLIGVIAGFLHLSIVMHTAAWHGGLDLYNNGFAGGLTATLLVSLIEWYRAHRDEFTNPDEIQGETS